MVNSGKKTAERENDSKPSKRGASHANASWRDVLARYFRNHQEVVGETLNRLWSTPFSTLMTTAVVAVAVALPLGLYVFLLNVQQVAKNWDGNAQISIFLKDNIGKATASELQIKIQRDRHVSRVEYISQEQALEELEQVSGYADLLNEFETNPLPAVIVVYLDTADVAIAEQLKSQYRQWPEVQMAQLDADWIKKLHSMVGLGKKIVAGLGASLALAVFLIVVNTIRLALESRKKEIEIYQIVGATNSYIRRPFLYTGLWFGVFGGLVAVFSVELFLFNLQASVSELASYYQGQYIIKGMNFESALYALMITVILGISGAWIAVARHLAQYDAK